MKHFFYCIVTLFCIVYTGTSQVVSTFAGSGVAGSTNGTGTAAQFNNPSAICADASHNVYVADSNNNVIRKISTTGVVTTLAGSGVAGFADGNGTAAQFNNPSGICVDYLGNLYVADTNNNKIRKITAAGVVTTFAGSTQGYIDGTGTIAKFNAPTGICYSGNLYVTDTNNNRIRKITSTGVVTTLAGSIQGYADGSGTAAQFNAPKGVCLYENYLFVADSNNNRIRRVTSTGVVSTFAGSTQGYADGIGTVAKFNNPVSISNDSKGRFYVTDQNNNRIRKIDYTNIINYGSVTTYSGSNQGFLDGTVSTALFNAPNGIFVDTNVVYLTDSGNNRIRQTTICDIPPIFQYNWNGYFYCSTIDNIDVMEISGTYSNITFFSTPGLSLNASTGSIAPSASIPGYYGVTCTATPYGCPNVSWQVDVNIETPPTATISYPNSSYYISVTTAQAVTLSGTGNYLGGSFSSLPSGLNINDSTGEIYPNSSVPGTYTVSYFVVSGASCQTNATTQVVILPQPNIGTLSLSSSNTTVGLFDSITVNVQLTDATDLYSLFMKLKGNAAVSQYLDYSGYTAGTLFGSSVISTPPTVTNGVPDFGITKVGAVPGYTGSGLFYSFTFVPKNITIPSGTNFCFYLDEVNAYNSTGIPCLLTNQAQICYTFTNQVAVWPGDLNKSNSVTTADLLPIGYFYNATGPTRPNATIQWNAQPATLWGYNHSSPNSNGYKVFADSNGDGVINNADQAAIGFNMNRVHSKMNGPVPSPAPPQFTSQQLTTAVGTLNVIPNTSIINGATLPQTVTFSVNVNNTGGLNALYGISVNLVFDETVFDLSTVTVDYTGSIFGNTGSDCLVINYNSTTMVSVGLTRYANAGINGQGLLFNVTLQTKSTLPNLIQTPITAYVDAANNQAGDILVIQDAPVNNLTIINNLGTNIIKSDKFIIYPNPASDKIYLEISSNNTQTNNLNLKVYNILGQSVEELPIQNSTMEISTKNWGANGVYFVKIVDSSTSGVIDVKKIILQ